MDEHLCGLYVVLDYTVAGVLKAGHTHLLIECRGCGKSLPVQILNGNGWNPAWHLSELARRLVCDRAQGGCGARYPKIETTRFSTSIGHFVWPATWGGHRCP